MEGEDSFFTVILFWGFTSCLAHVLVIDLGYSGFFFFLVGREYGTIGKVNTLHAGGLNFIFSTAKNQTNWSLE